MENKSIEALKRGIEKKERNSKLTERQKKNRIKKDLLKLDKILNKPMVERIDINIEWKKSQTWGYCPRLEAKVKYKNGNYEHLNGYYASGCGYDKESAVIASMLNDVMDINLLDSLGQMMKNKNVPYGIATYGIKEGYLPSFEGGVGVNCYYDIMKFLKYKLTKTASGDSFDCYIIEANKK